MRKAVIELLIKIAINKYLFVLVIFVLVFPFIFGIQKIQFDPSVNGIIPQNNKSYDDFNKMVDEFETGIPHFITIHNPDSIYKQKILEATKYLTDKLEAIPHVMRVVSPYNVQNLVGRGEVLNIDPLLIEVPETEQELSELKKEVDNNELIINDVVSSDGQEIVIHLYIDNRKPSNKLASELCGRLDELILEAEGLLQDSTTQIYHAGPLLIEAESERLMHRDLVILIPLGISISFLIFYITYGSLISAVIPSITSILSILMTIGFMGYFSLDITPITIAIPILLLVVGSTEDLHLISKYNHKYKETRDKRNSLRGMLSDGLSPITLTCVTTIVGFMPFLISELPLLREFGLAASFGLLANYLVTLVCDPFILNLGLYKPKDRGASSSYGDKVSYYIYKLSHENYIRIFILSLFVMVLGIVSFFYVKPDTDYLSFFKKSSKVNNISRKAKEHIHWNSSLFFLLEGDENNKITSPEVIQWMHRFAGKLEQEMDCHVVGASKYINKIHKEMHPGEGDAIGLPNDQNLIEQYFLLLDPPTKRRFLDSSGELSSMEFRCKSSGSRDTLRTASEIELLLKSFPPPNPIKLNITGFSYLNLLGSDYLSHTIWKSLIFIYIILSLIIFLLSKSFLLGVIAMLPNILPSCILFLSLFAFNESLNISTFVVIIVITGIAVDDTIHMLFQYKKQKAKYSEKQMLRRGLLEVIRKEFIPVVSSSIGISLGFLVLFFAEFLVLRTLGVYIAIGVMAALVCDLVIFPSLLRMNLRRGKFNKNKRMATYKER